MFYQEALYVGRQKIGQALNLVHKGCDFRAAGQAVQHTGSSWVLQDSLAECVENGGYICGDLLHLSAQATLITPSWHDGI